MAAIQFVGSWHLLHADTAIGLLRLARTLLWQFLLAFRHYWLLLGNLFWHWHGVDVETTSFTDISGFVLASGT
jgi:hypothetical protein